MKKIYSLIILSCIAGAALAVSSCADPAIGGEYGNALVYMPQATHNIGVDNNLEITVSVAEASGTVTQTTLGAYRSGTQLKQSVTVQLSVNSDTLDKAKAIAATGTADSKYEIYKTAVLLDGSYYDELPGTLTIPDGEREATTQLVLHDADILKSYNVGSILVLPVEISNPTRYELNPSYALTMVVLTITE